MRIDNGNASPERIDRAWKIAQRYLSNIRKTRGWQSGSKRADNMADTNMDGAMNEIRKINSRRYSQSTYMMGNANK